MRPGSRYAVPVLLVLLGAGGVGSPRAQEAPEPGTPDSTEEPTIEVRTATEPIGGDPFAVDRGPLDHLGWGSLEDLYVDLGAGAAVNVFSGNLVVSLQPFVRADAVPDSQLGLTYNHLDTDGSLELAPGWTYDLGRFWTAGPWGDRVLVDADGFRDSFFEGDLPTIEESRRLLDDVVRAWRRKTPLRQRRQAGGELAFREMLGSDPLFFGEMRLRLLGPPDPLPPSDKARVWVSDRRGARSMVDDVDDGSVVLERSDGGREVYSLEGKLQKVEARGSAPIVLQRDGERLSGVEVGGAMLYRVYRDSWERLRRVRSVGGREAEFDYVGRQLFRLRTPVGEYKFAYDGQGRLLVMDSPRGVLQVRYDGRSGRVAEAKGPDGWVQLSDLRGRSPEATVRVTLEQGEVFTCSWNARTRRRQIKGTTLRSSVRFETSRPLPVEIRGSEREVDLLWDPAGRLLELSSGKDRVIWERDEAGLVVGLVGSDGQRAIVEQGDTGILGWRDPEDRTTGVNLGPLGLPKLMTRPGGLTETIWRTRSGQIRSVKQSGGESLEFRRDNRGFLRTVESVESGSVGLRVGPGGRLLGYSAPSGLGTSLRYRLDGGLESLSDGYAPLELDYDTTGRLAGWRGPWGTVEIARDDRGRVVGFDEGEGARWTLERNSLGQPNSYSASDGKKFSFDWSADGDLLGWSSGAVRSTRYERDSSGRVSAWDDGVTGRVQLYRDLRGRIDQLKRGTGTWKLTRDRTGQVTALVDPAGSETQLQLDGAGRPGTISAPAGLRWRLGYDPLGRLSELRTGSVGWSLRFTRSGLPRDFSDPTGQSVELRWDRAGRWTSIGLPGAGPLEAGYSPLGPSSVGGLSRSYSVDGMLVGWGPLRSSSGWTLSRSSSGQIQSVRWRTLSGGKGSGGDPPGRDLQWNSAGLPLGLGDWTIEWSGGRPSRLELAVEGRDPRTWQLERDRLGRVVSLADGDERQVEVARDPLGDVQTFSVGGQSWSLLRDSSGRINGISDSSGRSWSFERDPAGRVSRWLRLGDFQIEWFPTDSSADSSSTLLSELHDVEVTDSIPEGGKPAGSGLTRVRWADGTTVLSLDEERAESGALERVEGTWRPELLAADIFVGSGSAADGGEDGSAGATGGDAPLSEGDDPIGSELSAGEETGALEGGEPDSDDSEGAAPGGEVDLIGEAIAAAREDTGIALTWGSTVVLPVRGDSFLPSPLGRGVGLSSSGWQRLAADDGGTVTWFGEGGVVNGLRVPRAFGPWRTPAGWIGYPAPPATLDPVVYAPLDPASHPGDARAVELWWAGLGIDADRLARLPAGIPGTVVPGVDPRESLRSSSSLLPHEEPPGGAGVLLPAIPGATRLLPQRADRVPLGIAELLVLSGDLPPGALDHRRQLPGPREAWQTEVPATELIRAILGRRDQPSLPPGWSLGAVAGLSGGLDGLRTPASFQPRGGALWGLSPVTVGLPGGVADVLPSSCELLPGAQGSLPGDGRCSALEGLSDDPLVPGAARRQVSEDDSMLLFLRAMDGRALGDLGGWLRPSSSSEVWVLRTPSGLAAIVDGRGRLLGLSAHGRQRRAWARAGIALAGRSLLHPLSQELSERAALLAPTYLPMRDVLPEARWGLVPGTPWLPIGALGEPLLPELRSLSPLSSAASAPWLVPSSVSP